MTEIRERHPDGHRRLWQISGFGHAVFAVFWGLGYALHGNRDAVSPALYVVKQAPGHMHTIGILSFLIGCWLLVDTFAPERFYRHRGLWAFNSLCIGMTVCILGAWWVTGQSTLSAPWAFVAFLIIASGMMLYPPPPKWKDGGGA